MSALLMMERVRNLAEKLGRKMGPACALVLSGLSNDIVLGALNFQTLAERDIGLRVAFFTNMKRRSVGSGFMQVVKQLQSATERSDPVELVNLCAAQQTGHFFSLTWQASSSFPQRLSLALLASPGA